MCVLNKILAFSPPCILHTGVETPHITFITVNVLNGQCVLSYTVERHKPQCAALVDQLAHSHASDVKFASFYTRRPLNQALSWQSCSVWTLMLLTALYKPHFTECWQWMNCQSRIVSYMRLEIFFVQSEITCSRYVNSSHANYSDQSQNEWMSKHNVHF